MDKEFDEFIKKFKRISKKRWIKGLGNNTSSNGLTFEKELGKKADSLYFPDYYGLELKCTSRWSRYPINLFSVTFDGPTFPEINRIVSKYGWPDKDFKNKKVLFVDVKYNDYTNVKNKYKFKFQFDNEKNKLYLCVYDMNNNLVEKESFVYTLSIYNHLMLKLQNLVIIYSSKKKENDELWFRYYKMQLYKLKNFDTFLELIERDLIKISIISRISKSGYKKGKYANKNIVFFIKKENIELLFDKVYELDCDVEDNFYIF